MLIFGAVGYLMVVGGWPRAPFVLGLVLGKIAENYLYISVARYEAAWLTRPIVLVLIALAIAVICYPLVQSRRSRLKEAARHRSEERRVGKECRGRSAPHEQNEHDV